MPKYFISAEVAQLLRDGNSVADFDGELEHHLVKVLRVRVGEEVLLCDGCETDFHCTVTQLSPLMLSAAEIRVCENEPDYKITLYQGMPKAGKMDLIIQKAVELGVWAIAPVIMERSVSHSKKEKRYQKIAESAAGQSMRGIVPKILPPVSWKDAVRQAPARRTMFAAYENENKSTLKDAINGVDWRKVKSDVGVWIGPEGGFSEREVAEMRDKDFKLFSLGSRILRTETAGLAALAQFYILNTDF